MANERYKLCIKLLTEKYKRAKDVEEIFSGAALRQAALVSLCFDTCIESLIDYEDGEDSLRKLKEIGVLPVDATKVDISQAVKASDFLPIETLPMLSEEDLRNARGAMTAFLKSNCGIIIIVDGDVKSEKRFWEKVEDSKDRSPFGIKDVNRLTVASYDYPILERFEKFLALRVDEAGERRCAKESWEFKFHGLLSKSNIITIEGFPAEVHLNEPKQLLLGNTVTHHAYEVLRANTHGAGDRTRFNNDFRNLPLVVLNSICAQEASLDIEDVNIFKQLQGELSELVQGAEKAKIVRKKQILLNFNCSAHELLFNRASPEWKRVYYKARRAYNARNEAGRPAGNGRPQIGSGGPTIR